MNSTVVSVVKKRAAQRGTEAKLTADYLEKIISDDNIDVSNVTISWDKMLDKYPKEITGDLYDHKKGAPRPEAGTIRESLATIIANFKPTNKGDMKDIEGNRTFVLINSLVLAYMEGYVVYPKSKAKVSFSLLLDLFFGAEYMDTVEHMEEAPLVAAAL